MPSDKAISHSPVHPTVELLKAAHAFLFFVLAGKLRSNQSFSWPTCYEALIIGKIKHIRLYGIIVVPMVYSTIQYFLPFHSIALLDLISVRGELR